MCRVIYKHFQAYLNTYELLQFIFGNHLSLCGNNSTSGEYNNLMNVVKIMKLIHQYTPIDDCSYIVHV